jgi:hypothetical protein
MITDALLAPLVALMAWLERTLPDGEPLPMTGASGLTDTLAGLNSMLPVQEVMQVAIGLLGLVTVFVTVRMVLVVRHVLLP